MLGSNIFISNGKYNFVIYINIKRLERNTIAYLVLLVCMFGEKSRNKMLRKNVSSHASTKELYANIR